ncbi:MAG: serine/threonine protein kinase [Armatimonadetes bacterium]|nr:serine/threonine protein kinase [Armatimonadota bacterium]
MIDELPQGAILNDKFRILSLIGKGATSRVYLARDLGGVGQYWAVKEITTHHLSPEDARAMAASFLREGAFLAELNHDGLPKVHDYFELGPAYYLVMEWIAGQTLLTAFEERGSPFPVTDVITWGMDLCRILGYLHALEPHPVVVGDLKPGNIMRTYDGRLKIVDFGVARYAKGVRMEGGYTFVTPGFSPPEQYESHSLDTRSDIYALGATMYYLMTGQDLERFKFQVPPLRRFVPTASPQIEELLQKCLHPDRTARNIEAGALRRRLQGTLDAENARPQPAREAKDILSSLYEGKRRNVQGIRESLTEN